MNLLTGLYITYSSPTNFRANKTHTKHVTLVSRPIGHWVEFESSPKMHRMGVIQILKARILFRNRNVFTEKLLMEPKKLDIMSF